MTSQIQLRGHHLSNLANEYWTRTGRRPVSMDSLPFIRAAARDEKKDYGKEFVIWKKDFYGFLLSNPANLVDIVEGLDSICNKPCTAYTEKCLVSSANEDSRTLEEYGLKVGDTLKVSELIEVFEKYHERTWFWTPRDKVWQEQDRRRQEARK